MVPENSQPGTFSVQIHVHKASTSQGTKFKLFASLITAECETRQIMLIISIVLCLYCTLHNPQ